MDLTAAYTDDLLEALRRDPDRFALLLRRRWRGEDGPPLDNDRSWCDLLFFVYDETPEDDRGVWAMVLCDLFDEFTTGRLLRLTTEDRLVLLGALELAQAITWSTIEAARIDAVLVGTLRLALSESFPPPRDLLKEDDVFGQPEVDVATALLRLAVPRLEWNNLAEEHWNLALESQDGFSDDVVAWRMWEIARWAVGAGQNAWLAARLDVLDEHLEASGCAPGNLTRLFFLTEFEKGPEVLADLLLHTFRSTDPVSAARRHELADKLDYFGKSRPGIREELWRRKGDQAAPIAGRIPEQIEEFRHAFSEGQPAYIVMVRDNPRTRLAA